MTTTDYRLPATVLPQHYTVDIDATPKRKGFFGTLGLIARVTERTDTVELHARGVSVKEVVAKSGKKKLEGKVKKLPERETVELVFPEPLAKGKVELSMAFRGTLSANMHGLYLAKDGKDKAIASQCEATDARAIFPCMDEPDFKATLQWTVRTDPGLTVICNGLLEKVRKSKGRVVHLFKKTRVISTYLAALTIGKYEATQPKRVKGTPCRIVTVPGKLGLTEFSESVTSQVIPWYEDYFGHKYNYQKLDQVAVPGFDAGAMENVGAVLYRQSLLLMQPGVASWGAQKRIAEVVAHEIAHMWFGNLVTMKWWDDLWLNEAFATWIAYSAVHAWKPDWRMWDEYQSSRQSALAADSLVNTHPIYTPVKTPAEATELFDLITYEKGCAVLRMAESYLGFDTFRDGIRRYIQAFKNDNAQGRDLWNALGDESGQPIAELMKSWVTQSGFPLLSISMTEVDGKTRVTLKQRRFFANRDEMQKTNDQLWQIPLVLRFDTGSGAQTQRHVMTRSQETVELPAGVRWLVPNAEASGFYRAELSSDALDALLEHGFAALSPAERMSLIEDEWALVRNGRADITRFMRVLTAYRDENDYIVTRALAGRLGYLDAFLVRDEDRERLAGFVNWLFGNQMQELGWDAAEGEGEADAVRRASVIGALGEIGRNGAVLGEANARLPAEMEDPAAIEPNLAGVVVHLGAVVGDSKQLDRYLEVYERRRKQRLSPELQLRYLGAMGSFEDRKAVAKALKLCLDGTVPQEGLRTVMQPLLTARVTGVQTWTFMKKNWKTIAPQVGAMGISRLVEATGALPVELRDDVAGFFEKNPVEEATRALKLALEAMDLRAELIAREAKRLGEWLSREVSAVA